MRHRWLIAWLTTLAVLTHLGGVARLVHVELEHGPRETCCAHSQADTPAEDCDETPDRDEPNPHSDCDLCLILASTVADTPSAMNSPIPALEPNGHALRWESRLASGRRLVTCLARGPPSARR